MQIVKLLLVVDTRATEIIERDQNGGFIGSSTFTPGGIELCQAVMEYLKTEHQFAISRLSAEMALLGIGSALPASEGWTMAVMGRNLNTGLPQRREISTNMIQEPIDRMIGAIVDSLANRISRMKTAFATDRVFDNDIILSGEYCDLKGLKKRLGDAIRAEAMPEAHITIVPWKYP